MFQDVRGRTRSVGVRLILDLDHLGRALRRVQLVVERSLVFLLPAHDLVWIELDLSRLSIFVEWGCSSTARLQMSQLLQLVVMVDPLRLDQRRLAPLASLELGLILAQVLDNLTVEVAAGLTILRCGELKRLTRLPVLGRAPAVLRFAGAAAVFDDLNEL